MSSRIETASLIEHMDPARLRARLVAAFGPAASRHVRLGLGSAERTIFAGGSPAETHERVASAALRMGCLTKLLTAEMTRAAAKDGLLALDEDCADRLGAARPRISGVSVRHLLEHTHGLDGSRLERLPRQADGRIDARRLQAAAAAAPKVAPPGRLYSYGDLGPWLAAAVLERSRSRRYPALLRDWLLEHAQGPPCGASEPVCPSRGAGLALTHAAALEVLSRALGQGAPSSPGPEECFGPITPLPGWSLLEQGVLLGWKHYGSGWFGHHSTEPGAEALVRVNAEKRVALIVSSRDVPALVVAARLFGALLPEFAVLRVPRALPSHAVRRLDLRRSAGTYANAAETITITAAADGGLRLQACLRAAGGSEPERVAARLQPAEGGVLLTVPVQARLPFVQRVCPPGERRAYLWNGRNVWPRTAP